MDDGMDKAGARLFLVYLLGLVALMGGLALAKGGLYVDRHEGDTLHLIEILLRMSEGQWPHLDFVTPLGVLAFLPIVAFVWAGFGVGAAIVLGQISVALMLVPMVWWLGRSRLTRGMAYGVGALVMVLALAMIHGEAAASLSLSMHYNRWAWAFAFVAILVAVLEPKHANNQWVDGVILGVAFSFFVMGKITYGVAFAPGVALALVLRGQWRAISVALAVVALFAIALTFMAGPAMWWAYLGDLALVASTDIRPRAGVDLATLLTAPQYVLGNAVLVLSVLVLRRGVDPKLGLVLMLLAPGMIYVTYQNYGNDPKWLALLAVMILAVSRTPQIIALAVVACTLIAPSFFNMATSPARHFVAKEGTYRALFFETPYADRHGDFFTKAERVNRILKRVPMQFESEEFAYLNTLAAHLPPAEFQGEGLASCVQELGLIGASHAMARDLDRAGLAEGKSVFVADTFGNLWMFGNLSPTKGAAPWYYGRLTGYDAADYFLIPTCPTTPQAYRSILKDVEARGEVLTEVRRTELYILYARP
ncbi:hypothetical protein [Litoreibacter janthinus]|uniref:Dolichyl-phosphate-mannose-protein mannosyltransferase n=1 Tax=Litoreibacter janthinus TaxID=670154 RepID=A0A1I6HT28_9RHOB|nr:hypothetical protein [Litoreibacter janthinus]SFR57611.1 hypothetical protein SAMN04488002_3398 [Litoreibacter janthinus]